MTWPPDPDAATEPHVRAFFDDIADHPREAAVRLVFADWLEERDDPRAELLRLQGENLNGKLVGDEARTWWQQHGAAWFGAELTGGDTFEPLTGRMKLWQHSAQELLHGSGLLGLRRAMREGWVQDVTIFDWTAAQVKRGGELRLYAGPNDLSFAFCDVRDGALERVREHLRLRHFMVMGRALALGDAGLAPVGSLTGLKRLNLCQLPTLTGATLEVLAPLTQLTWLQFGHCPALTNRGLARLPPLPALEGLYLGDAASLTGAGLSCLERLPAVHTLFLARCGALTDAGLAHVGRVPDLQELCLSECVGITDAGLAHLRGLAALQTLELQDCRQLTGAGFAHLHALTGLRTLKANRDRLRSHEVAALHEALPDCKVEWK